MKKIFTQISLMFIGLMLCAGNAWGTNPTTAAELQAAIDAASTTATTITLGADVTSETAITIAEGQTITLNLNGHSILSTGMNVYAVTIDYGGNLTIKGSGSISANYMNMIDMSVYNHGILTLTDGDFSIGNPDIMYGLICFANTFESSFTATPTYTGKVNFMSPTCPTDPETWCDIAGGLYSMDLTLPINPYAFETEPAFAIRSGYEQVTVTEDAKTWYAVCKTIPASGTVTIADDATASESMLSLIYRGEDRDLQINRPAQKGNQYNTICLPFALDADQIANSSLADAEIYKFSNAAKDGDYLDLHFQPVTAIEAGVPYFFRFPTSGDNLSSLTFEGVTVTTTTPQDVTHNGVTLHGTLSQVTISGSGKLYLAAGNNLKWYDGDKTINPFRAYFEVAGGLGAAPKARIVAHENATTGVEDVTAEGKAVKFVENGQILIKRGEAVYNLQGQVVK